MFNVEFVELGEEINEENVIFSVWSLSPAWLVC